jgi:hypothetical protein
MILRIAAEVAEDGARAECAADLWRLLNAPDLGHDREPRVTDPVWFMIADWS